MENGIFTIGHSTLQLEKFVALLHRHGVTTVADVRSAPYSRFSPTFNRETLQASLRENGIGYVFLGEQLGGRPKDPTCYENNRVSYGKMSKTALFHAGLDRLCQESESHRLAMMCAEQDPVTCHRTLLVARVLASRAVPVLHIHADGSLETHDLAETRLLHVVGLPAEDLFRTREELLDEAYALQELRVAYVAPTEGRSIRSEHR
jgi:uncharacterized protein (DUF488 family)